MNPVATTNPLSRQRRKEARPAELTAAALELFVERGFAATRLDDVAARAGVSKGTLYLYFASKEELFKAVIQQGLLPVLAQGEEMMAQHRGDASTLLRELILRWWALVVNTPLSAIPKLIISESGNFPEVARYFQEQVGSRKDQLLGNVLQKGMQSGEFRQLDIPATIDLISAPILMRVLWRYSLKPCGSGQQDDETYLNTYLDLLLNGLRTKGVRT
ncbi:MAG: TetR/AcrR family transcriptional regulator [Sideroxydans sp.]|nr:TetR/AcrR family transcriptional regulator [Sideroxydans sp.]